MKLRIPQPILSDAIQGWGRHYAAERAWSAEAAVVGHDEKNVGRVLGRDDARRPPRLGIRGALLYHATERQRWRRDLFSINRSGGARRTWGTSGLDLCSCGRRNRHDDGSEHPGKDDLSC